MSKPAVDLLLNDLYQFTCSYTYFCSNKHEQQATFEVFFRKYPFGGQYAIFAGLEEVRNFLKNLSFTQEHEDYLRKTLPHISNQYYQWIKQDFSSRLKVRCFKEGEIVFAKEPLISYTGPLSFVQLLETPILNLIGFASLVATNASRLSKAIQPKKCIEMGTRRAQGPDGALTASAYAYLGGFFGTSNMKASQIWQIPCYGTMSHAFITSFVDLSQIDDFKINGVGIKQKAIQIKKQLGFKTHDGELAAFIAYSKSFSTKLSTLIDTYSTMDSGILNTIIVSKALVLAGITNFGIRLDSGDLCQLSKQCREVWNKYVPDHRLTILASDDLHEERLIKMQQNKSQIDIYGIGTHIATCKKQPALGLVCKLIELNKVPRMKLSADIDKATLPGNKTTYRVWIDNSKAASLDLISLSSQTVNEGENVVFLAKGHKQTSIKITKIEQLNNKFNISQQPKSLTSRKEYLELSKSKLSEKVFDLQKAFPHDLYFTKNFLEVLLNTLETNKKQMQ